MKNAVIEDNLLFDSIFDVNWEINGVIYWEK